jgi:hypothetical protein
MFVKGQSGNPNGRPVGAKDKKWASLDYWYGLVLAEWPELKPSDRAWIALAAWKTLAGRDRTPLTPEESVKNTQSAMNALKLLEEATRNVVDSGRSSGRDTISVVNWAAPIQAQGPTIPSL